jgi:glucoamylase
MPLSDWTYAPGWPGIPARWTSSAKSGVGTALGSESRVWFTTSHGIIDEVYYPSVDRACTRDLGLIVTDGLTFFSEEKRDADSETSPAAPGVPAYRLRNTCKLGRYRIEKDIITDPRTDVVLQWVKFIALQGAPADYRLFVLLAPHLDNRGSDNTAWVGDYKGVPMLFASRNGVALALACSAPWRARSVGFVGVTDGWQELNANKQLTRLFTRAESGNVALTGELTIDADGCLLALGFGTTAAEAGQHARASLTRGFDAARREYVAGWSAWQKSLGDWSPAEPRARDLCQLSAAVLRTHEAKHFPGGVIASLSIPWGFAKGDDDLGGYHLVWPRDLASTAGGFLAVGAYPEAVRVLQHLRVTQEADGHWSQNMWLDGTPYWTGIQMDETALPILLVDLASREGALGESERRAFWPMVQRAAGFLVRNGPVSPQDRWEEDPGYSPFTLAAEIAALLAGADLAEECGAPVMARYLRETADAWNASVEEWIYVTGTPVAREQGVDGYYVRVAQPEKADASSPIHGFVPIKNRPPGEGLTPEGAMVSPDALALVRFGLRAPDDPRVVATVTVIDALLKVTTPNGSAWHRYNGDGYGEHEDGGPFDGTGVGRAWPLLSGERAHYEIAAGRMSAAEDLARTVEAFAGASGLLPEQVWDAPDIPERELVAGKATGSARPLAWAHAEYVKLRRSLHDGCVFDRPRQAWQRYVVERRMDSTYVSWRFNNKIRSMRAGRTLRIELLAAARVRWGTDGWQREQDVETADTGLGVHIVDLDTRALVPGSGVDFTFYWRDDERWEGVDFRIGVEAPPPGPPR